MNLVITYIINTTNASATIENTDLTFLLTVIETNKAEILSNFGQEFNLTIDVDEIVANSIKKMNY